MRLYMCMCMCMCVGLLATGRVESILYGYCTLGSTEYSVDRSCM